MVDLTPNKIWINFLGFFAIVIYHPLSYAWDWDWKITPKFTVSETYSDNINLAPSGREKGAFVTQLIPGVSIQREGARNKFNLDYQMQNLSRSSEDNNIEVFHQLETDSHLEIARNVLFLDLDASINQQNTTNFSSSANDNISGRGNRTNVTKYGFSPYWTPHFAGHVDGDVRFKYRKLMTDNGQSSDTENLDYSVRFKSGRRFSRVTWLVEYIKRDELRDNADDVKFQDALLELRGHINRHFSVFTRIGHSKNNFQTTTGTNENGFFYSVGGRWKPSERLSLEAAVGNNSFVTVDVRPTRHMHWITTFRNNDKGTNTGNVWQSSFDYRTKRSIWKASYQEDTTTIQNELADSQIFTARQQFNVSLPTLGDEALLVKRAMVSVKYETGKSKVFARLFSNRTTFQQTQNKNNVYGIDGGWDWEFTRRSSFYIRPAWQKIQRTTIAAEAGNSKRYDIALGLNRNTQNSSFQN